MKILLIYADKGPRHLPPLGLMYISSYLKKYGYNDIVMIDTRLAKPSIEELRKEIKKADIVGISCMTCHFLYANEIAKICKEESKLTVLGGVHASIDSEEVLNENFDIVVNSEGEETFLDIIRTFEESKPFSYVKGIYFKDNGIVVRTENREFITNLDSLPFPDRKGINIKAYKLGRTFFNGEYTSLMTSRGCPNACTFCNSPVMWRKRVRMRSLESVFKEIEELYYKYNFKCLTFLDDTFTMIPKRVDKLCDMLIESDMDIQFHCITRPEKLDYKLLKKMKKAGCVAISIGAESGNLEILRKANKNFTPKQVRKAFEYTYKLKINSMAYFMIGLPGETIRTIFQTIKFAKSLKADTYNWAILIPYPGTEIYEKDMIEIKEKDYSKWTFYKPVIKVGNLSSFELNILQKIANFYCNGFNAFGPTRKLYYAKKYYEKYGSKQTLKRILKEVGN